MILLVSKFLHPYFQFIAGAALSFLQVTEGLEFSKSEFFRNHLNGFLPVAYALMLVFALLLPLVGAAAYTVGRCKGVVAFLCLLLAPGILNLFGGFPDIQYSASRFSIGSVGVLGTATGLIPLLVVATITGWSFTVLLYDTLRLTERFRQYYDHFWFLTALATAVFFVTDISATDNTKRLNEASRVASESNRYLLSQVRRYQDYCKDNGLEATKSCQWSNYSQWVIKPLADYGPSLFVEFGPASSREMYQPSRREVLSDEDVLTIRSELLEYNQKICPMVQLSKGAAQYAQLSDRCEEPPFDFCNSWPDGPEGFVDRYIANRPVAIANECIIPNLVSLRSVMPKMLESEHEAKEGKNYRWLYFLFIALAVGGKVANSSTKLAKIDDLEPLGRGVVIRDLVSLVKFLATRAAKGWGCARACALCLFQIAKGKYRDLSVWLSEKPPKAN
ncbi:hypothetical protein [Pseudomonas syringae]|nr:hypothetical protein [Pseudomonas syringae]